MATRLDCWSLAVLVLTWSDGPCFWPRALKRWAQTSLPAPPGPGALVQLMTKLPARLTATAALPWLPAVTSLTRNSCPAGSAEGVWRSSSVSNVGRWRRADDRVVVRTSNGRRKKGNVIIILRKGLDFGWHRARRTAGALSSI